MGIEKTTQANAMKYVSLVTLTVQNSAVALSMRYARTRSGEMFIASSAVVMAEVVKLLASLLLVYKQEGSLQHWFMTLHTHIWQQKMDTLKVSVPSFIYLVQNNLLYVSASNLDAATYQVTYQMKILTTAVFAVLLLRRELRSLQWLALVLLTAGVALVQLSATDGGTTTAATAGQSRVLGCVAAIAACCCSGFAGIYFEKILKGSEISVWVRNVQLSLLSLPLGAATALATDGSELMSKGFLHGYDGFVWYLVCLNALGGLLVALVVKYADNILKGFATSLAIVLSTIISAAFLGFVLTVQFAVGTALVIVSVFLYSHQPRPHPPQNPMVGKMKVY
ncbi:UDP-galactose translocator-like isoform X1 [Portunus trituberculatus]|uniref:UDP-galactose translocator-like isoform X1 n=1 Tax=Portunus trituberculatus TaxID=210409 RepID=UPI001E1CD286|nr:UDP-galactose translocator-like isoform X1 [Portunus trituberculatus]